MSELKRIFTSEEIEEIEIFCDGTEAMSVEGEEIICFRMLSDLLSEKTDISDVPKNELLQSYAQLKGFREIISSFGFVDVSLLENIAYKAKKIIMDELDVRKKLEENIIN
jgi:hypothetical protein